MANRGLAAGAAFAVAILLPATGHAEVKEYQIRRMLYLNTACGVSGLEISVKDGQDRFFATCENVAHYPDGIEVLCPATEDERECRIVTAKREFRHLRHLEQ